MHSAVRYPRNYAGWAIASALDTAVVAQLRSAEFAEALRSLVQLEDSLESESDTVSELLYRMVPRIADKAPRQRVIRCRRRLYGWEPLVDSDLAPLRDQLRKCGPRDAEETLLRFHDRLRARESCLDRLDRAVGACTATTRRLLHTIRDQADHPMNLGVAFSAPDLWSALGRSGLPSGQQPLNRQELSYLSYLLRTATKCTAYSTFGEIRMLMGDGTSEESGPRDGGPHRLVEVNSTLPEIILDAVLRQDPAAMNETLIVSTYLRGLANSFAWTQASEAFGLGRSVHRNKVRLLTGDDPRVATLAVERAEDDLDRLVGFGMVVRGPRSFGTDAALAALRRTSRGNGSAVCEDLMAACDRMGAAPARERAELSTHVRAAGEELIGLLGGPSVRGTVEPVCYETSYGSDIRLPEVFSRKNLSDLRRLEGILPIFDPISGLRRVARELFDRLHPTGRCGAMEFVFELASAINRKDTLERVGLVSLSPAGNGPTATTNCDRELRAILGEFPSETEEAHALPLDEMAGLAARLDWKPWHPVTDFAVRAQPRQDGTLVVEAVVDGWGRHISRYRHPVEPGECERHAARMPSIPGAEHIEMSGLLGFSGNVACRRTGRLLVMPGEEADPRAEGRLTLADLSVVASGDELHLIADADGTRLLPLYLGTLAVSRLGALHQAMLPFSQFYWTDLPFHRLMYDPGGTEDVVTMPRLVAGGLVVARKRWWVRAGSWPWWDLTGLPGARDYASLERWRLRHALPNEVYVRRRIPGVSGTRATKPQYVNFQSPSILQVAWKRFHGTPGDLVIEEALPGIVDGSEHDRPIASSVMTVVIENAEP